MRHPRAACSVFRVSANETANETAWCHWSDVTATIHTTHAPRRYLLRGPSVSLCTTVKPNRTGFGADFTFPYPIANTFISTYIRFMHRSFSDSNLEFSGVYLSCATPQYRLQLSEMLIDMCQKFTFSTLTVLV